MIASLLIGAVLGTISTVVIFRWVKNGTHRLTQQIADAIDQNGGRGVLRSARRQLLRPQWHRGVTWVIWPLLPIVNPVYYFTAVGPEGLVFVLSYIGFYLLSLTIGYHYWGREILKEYTLTSGKMIAVKLVRYQPEQAAEVLVPASRDSDPVHRLAIIPALVELGTADAVEALERLMADPDETIAAPAREALNRLRGYLVHPKAPYPELPTTVWRKPNKGEEGDDAHGGRVKVHDRKKAVQIMGDQQVLEILLPQLPLRRGYPALYCRECHATTYRYRFGEWDWVECRICEQQGQLEIGVREVYGEIGGDSIWQLDSKGVLHLRIWDPDRNTALQADITELHVYGGKGLDYDWAISATLETLAKRPSGWKIVYHNPPQLSRNTLMLIQAAGHRIPAGQTP